MDISLRVSAYAVASSSRYLVFRALLPDQLVVAHLRNRGERRSGLSSASYWSTPINNDSQRYNYYEWNKVHRPNASQFLREDPRPLPRPIDPVEMEPQVRPVCPVGGVIMFSGAQLH